MANDWYYKLMGEEVGPLSSAELRQHALDGKVSPETYVRRGESDGWESADAVMGLFDEPPSPLSESTHSVATQFATAHNVDNPPSPSQSSQELARPQTAEPSHRPYPPTIKASFGSGKSVVLFLIGIVLLVIAMKMNAELNERHSSALTRYDVFSQFHNSRTGRFDYDEPIPEREDQMGVYAVGCMGGLFILGGIILLGR